ncbi:ABC-F family ATP-binding cassette domain-containing protein [Halomonas dongshanensis]|uniref:ATP-binding cassette domain-containing protein n=1 Tax=Halomonas dongshanensis TaxID=2890835 RepID=A0ABT2EDT3_9GAMM|nr:ABC-F family ATP-binding cassette domain-containing protein [Halomonas dongshanensis]MCS2608797.1 ATP-binding cassette domain-containing protein [Halomonas dongshanensis]
MTSLHLDLHNVAYVLPNGRELFSGLNEQFDLRPVGLVGRNGVGKSLLARIMAGRLSPTTGFCKCSGNVYYLSQHIEHAKEKTVAALAGVEHILKALARIESGSAEVKDFDTLGDRWDIHSRLVMALEQNNLHYLSLDTPIHLLSGGEAMRIALTGAMLSDADFLILDEPSNHLDRENRQALIEQLQRWPRGLIVVSHDRQLLNTMTRIVELSPMGLQSYGGNYSFYSATKEHERQNALETLAERKLERQRKTRVMRQQVERQERRRARGNRQGKEANQAKVLLDRQKERSEVSSSTLRKTQSIRLANLDEGVREAAQQIEADPPVIVHDTSLIQSKKRRVVELEKVELPYVALARRTINLIVTGQQRVGIIGPNGCGKSTLLRMMAGRVAPLAGVCQVTPEHAYLDQQLDNLVPHKTVLEQLRSVNHTSSEGELRMRLAQLGIEAQKITTPSRLLSGGERLKAALACLFYADNPPQLLLLDEPNNHLDLPSLQALETMLRSYRGALIVVSHDDAFLESLGLTDHLLATDQGWRLNTISSA